MVEGYDVAMLGSDGGQPMSTIEDALRRSAELGNCGFFFDFDGVLASIQIDPDSVVPINGVLDELTKLGGLVKKIGIVSARPAGFLLSRFGDVPGIALYGLYGLEVVTGGVVHTDPVAESWIPAIQTAIRDARAELPAAVYIEDKRVSVSLHYREHPEHQSAVDQWAQAKAAQLGLIEQHGRMVAELKPPVEIDKGTVLRAQLADLSVGWYFGDDISDAKGFLALRERMQADPDFLAVCVAVHNTETGHELERQADFTLSGPVAMPEFLTTAVSVMSRQTQRP
jgi:trehalose 6-phosphate phosphatase